MTVPVKDPVRRRYLGKMRQRRLRAKRPKATPRVLLTPEELSRRNVARARRWQQSNPERKAEIEARWRENNKTRLAEIGRRANKRWRETHKHICTERDAKRRRARVIAELPWAETGKIRQVYKKAREYGFEVDHVVPLVHPLVCGLHVWANLQLLDGPLNRSKRNRSWPDMPSGVTPQLTTASSITEE